MLDLHAVTGTPGAATVLGATFPTICANDGQSVAGVPIANNAVLAAWGVVSIAANTIGAAQLQSQDMVDPINGEYLLTGAASILNIILEWTNLPYETGLRGVKAGTNTGVGAAVAFYLDIYPGGPVQVASRVQGNQVTPAAIAFGGALTTLQWGSQAYAPTTALPNGKYAILGVRVSALTNVGLIRFQHADFGSFLPGFPVANYEIISTSSWDKVDKDNLLIGQAGNQFVYLSDCLGQACVPVFSVTNAGTGLNIQMLTIATDTPVVTLCLAKVG